MITQNVAEQLKDSRIKVEALQEKNRRLDAQLSASNNKVIQIIFTIKLIS
jgi:hypothetical protein